MALEIGALQITAEAIVARAEILARIGRAAPGFAVMLRDPELDARALYDWGLLLRAATRRAGAHLIADDRIDLALAIEADGLHLGRRSVSVEQARKLWGARFISRSAHSVDEARSAADQGADAVLLAPIFASPGKTAPLGLPALIAARARMPRGVELIALGGVCADNAADCLQAGAGGIAAIRADLSTVRFERPARA